MTNRRSDLDCQPYYPYRPFVRDDGSAPTILELAARASDAAERYRRALDDRAPFGETLRVAGRLARATTELTTAITDAVATGDGTAPIDLD